MRFIELIRWITATCVNSWLTPWRHPTSCRLLLSAVADLVAFTDRVLAAGCGPHARTRDAGRHVACYLDGTVQRFSSIQSRAIRHRARLHTTSAAPIQLTSNTDIIRWSTEACCSSCCRLKMHDGECLRRALAVRMLQRLSYSKHVTILQRQKALIIPNQLVIGLQE